MTNRRLIVVSNRLRFNVSVSDDQFEFHDSAGGVATGLASYMQFRRRTGSLAEDLWVGWAGTSVEPSLSEDLKKQSLAADRSFPVFLSEEAVDQFYFGLCDSTIWPLFYYVPWYI